MSQSHPALSAQNGVRWLARLMSGHISLSPVTGCESKCTLTKRYLPASASFGTEQSEQHRTIVLSCASYRNGSAGKENLEAESPLPLASWNNCRETRLRTGSIKPVLWTQWTWRASVRRPIASDAVWVMQCFFFCLLRCLILSFCGLLSRQIDHQTPLSFASTFVYSFLAFWKSVKMSAVYRDSYE